MTDEEKKKAAEEAFFARLESKIEQSVDKSTAKLGEQMTELTERVAVMEEAENSHSLPGFDATKEKFKGQTYSYARAMMAAAYATSESEQEKLAPMEFALSKEIYQTNYTAQGTTPDSLGGVLVPNEVHNEMLVPLLRNRLIADKLGLTMMVDVKGTPVEIPKIVTGTTGEAVAENQGTPDQNATFGKLEMTPKTAQTYLKSSRDFLRMGMGAEGMLKKLMADGLAETYNGWLVNGTGVAGQPTGILNTTGIQTVTWSVLPNSSTAFAKLLATEGKLADNKLLETGAVPKWLVPYAFVRGLHQMKSENASASTESLDMARKVFSAAKEQKIIGYDYVESGFLSHTASGEALFGLWEEMIFAQWGNMTLEASNVAEDALRRRQTHIAVSTQIDYGVTRPTAFVSALSLDLSSF